MSAAAAKSLQSCPTLCDPIDSSPPGSPAPGILQATTLEWVAISFSNAWKWKVKGKSLSRFQLLATPWTAVAAKSLQSCLSLCDPMDSSPPGSLHPRDFPGKSTGVGCHCLLQYSVTYYQYIGDHSPWEKSLSDFHSASCLSNFLTIFLHDYWKKHNFDFMHLGWQSDVSAF